MQSIKCKFLVVLILFIAPLRSIANQAPFALEQFDIRDLKIYAIVRHDHSNVRYAYILDPKGFLYHLEIGENIGKHRGRIKKISTESIFYTELLPDGKGGFFEQDGEIKWLPPYNDSNPDFPEFRKPRNGAKK